MSELFDDDEQDLISEDEFAEPEEAIANTRDLGASDARRRLESLLEEKRLRDELEDYLDY